MKTREAGISILKRSVSVKEIEKTLKEEPTLVFKKLLNIERRRVRIIVPCFYCGTRNIYTIKSVSRESIGSFFVATCGSCTTRFGERDEVNRTSFTLTDEMFNSGKKILFSGNKNE